MQDVRKEQVKVQRFVSLVTWPHLSFSCQTSTKYLYTCHNHCQCVCYPTVPDKTIALQNLSVWAPLPSYHILQYCTASCHIVLYNTFPRRTMSCRAIPSHLLKCFAVSDLAISDYIMFSPNIHVHMSRWEHTHL